MHGLERALGPATHTVQPRLAGDFDYLTARGAQRFEVRELVRVSLARHEIAGVGASLLTVYRLAFGHARQEDLVAYLIERFGPTEALRLAEDLAIDLSPANLNGAR